MDLSLHLLDLFPTFDWIFSGSNRFLGTDGSGILFTIFIFSFPVLTIDAEFVFASWQQEMRHAALCWLCL